MVRRRATKTAPPTVIERKILGAGCAVVPGGTTALFLGAGPALGPGAGPYSCLRLSNAVAARQCEAWLENTVAWL